MSKKRSATTELNSDNWDVDDEPEEAGTFKAVDPDVLKKRVIKVARRKFSKTNPEQSKLFSGFSGFSKPNTGSTTPDVKNTFSFLSNLNGSSSQTASPSVPSAMPSLLSSSTSTESKPADSKPSNENLHATKIKVLNECLVEWISKWVSKNPTCVLTPVFRDYEKHLETIKSGIDCQKEESKPSEKAPELKFNFTPVFGNNQKPITDSKPSDSKPETFKMPESSPSFKNSSGWLKTGIGSLGENSLNSKPLFGFSSGKPSFLQNIGAPSSSESTANQDEGDDEAPIVNDFKPVTEDDALYSQRVKVFVKNNDSYSDRGVGNLFIKETKNDKGDRIYQAMVRADTALGNIIFNIRITKDIPTKRVGKNNVMLVCIPTPDSKPPPVPVLLRVKTEEDADKLLAEINKYK
ncbi:nuclear pore complex protein Nup50 [Halyomorpha halys]|uniref:nuclear pore complex protein Nup50 n=1 Tax=Halyomorpha halys TaxID=286706 RepID=UPI0006D52538|nr:nuclear pore complex protein Nup50 [Halyomorpha halys]